MASDRNPISQLASLPCFFLPIHKISLCGKKTVGNHRERKSARGQVHYAVKEKWKERWVKYSWCECVLIPDDVNTPLHSISPTCETRKQSRVLLSASLPSPPSLSSTPQPPRPLTWVYTGSGDTKWRCTSTLGPAGWAPTTTTTSVTTAEQAVSSRSGWRF